MFDLNAVSERDNEVAVDFVNTFASFKDADGNVYVLQRDLWAAFKMLCLDLVEETRVDKNTGKEYKVKVHKFNKERYDEKFKSWYPKQLEYIKYFIKCNNLGVDLNGLILGNK